VEAPSPTTNANLSDGSAPNVAARATVTCPRSVASTEGKELQVVRIVYVSDIESTEHVREPQVSFKSFGVIIETQTSVRIVPWHRIHSVDYPQQPSSAPAG
jgi:hypothetical protein